MSKIASIFLFVLMAGPALGQQEHFALIRADNDQPFYVHIRQQTLSSSAQGHLILSQLHDSLYPIAVGFPRQQFPEQEFTLKIDKNDLDLRLTWRQGKGWILVDMGTQEEQLPANDTTEKKTRLEGVKKDDAFSRLMADVVSDTAVMYNTYAGEASRDSAARITDSLVARKAADSLATRKFTDSLAVGKVASQTTASPPPTHDSASDSPIVRKMIPPDSVPARKTSAPDSGATFKTSAPDSGATGKTSAPDSAAARPVPKAAVFTGTLDSVKVDSPRPAKPAHIEKIAEQQTPTGLHISYTDRTKGQRTDTIDIQIPADSIQKTGAPIPAPARTKLVVFNSDCHNFASDDDVDKLKGRFQTLATDDARIAAAKKIFKLKCFTTNQLKALSESFPVEEAKYRFLQTSYPFVSDDGFRTLSGLFTDPIYIAKFKTLVGAP